MLPEEERNWADEVVVWAESKVNVLPQERLPFGFMNETLLPIYNKADCN